MPTATPTAEPPQLLSALDTEGDLIRGVCPRCGDAVVSRCWYYPRRGYLITWNCRGSLQSPPTCDYRRVL